MATFNGRNFLLNSVKNLTGSNVDWGDRHGGDLINLPFFSFGGK
jgi:hypothetical protein